MYRFGNSPKIKGKIKAYIEEISIETEKNSSIDMIK